MRGWVQGLALGLALCLGHALFFPSLTRRTLGQRRRLERVVVEMVVSSSGPSPVPVLPPLGGKVLITGIGNLDEDEFLLNLLNEQEVWNPVVLATSDSVVARKRFLSRTARYSGLLNILDFATANVETEAELQGVLSGANAWLAFNVSQSSIPYMAKAALSAGVQRFVVTMLLPPHEINKTAIPEFDDAIRDFRSAGASFTGIRHGAIIDGDENYPYEIYNATIPCLEETVERGVLARVAAEILMISDASNAQCGLSSSSPFSAAYLNILRSSGLNRRQEVTKIYQGGIQKVAQLTVAEYAAEAKRREAKKAAIEEKKAREELEAQQEAASLQKAGGGSGAPTSLVGGRKAAVDPDASITPNWDEDVVPEPETDEQKIVKRSEEILKAVWKEFETRMYAKSTSKGEFYDTNLPMARELAEKEMEAEKLRMQENEEDKAAKRLMLDRLVDINRKQYNKLLTLERKEMQNQKDISDTWVKYIYLLLETTMRSCKETDTLFHNMDEFGQTILLRQVANKLRADCGLPTYDVIYDPLDAAAIVAKLSAETGDIDATMAALTTKYGTLMKNVPALRGAAQIVEIAIETLQRELPPAPPSVNDIRLSESKGKRESISAGRLDKIKSRGQPDGGTGTDNGVGRM